jgi:hypothetical protein
MLRDVIERMVRGILAFLCFVKTLRPNAISLFKPDWLIFSAVSGIIHDILVTTS